MATVNHPPQTPVGPVAGNGAGAADGAGRSVFTWPRVLAVGGLALVVLIIAYLLFSGSSTGTYHLLFTNGGGLVRGDQVQVGGVPVGSVKNIELTSNNQAEITVEVQSSLLPLHQGTKALIRVPDLTSVAGRYISLSPGPNNNPVLPSGSTLSTRATEVPVDLDELFNTLNPQTRKGLEEFIEGNATQYQGVGKEINTATPYFSTALKATDHVFNEITREEPILTAALVEGAKTLETLADHGPQLSSLVRNGATTFGAVASEAKSLEEGLKVLPHALHEGNLALAEVPSTVASLERLVDVSKPNFKQLAPFLAALRGLFKAGTPVTGQLASAFSKPGPNNDLTDFARAVPGLYKSLQTSSPDAVKALEQSVPITNFFGPYSPDLIGLFRTFGLLAGYRDANGQYVRVSPNFADFKYEGEKLKPTTPTQGLEGLITKQLRRCPGAATQPAEDGSSPFTDEGLLGCDPSEVP
jgi:phospholipid/cholesterol/gamma-HCH transport system substrate-binding protein